MLYKVFLVEDEIVTREGIRDNVDWEAHGFEFCGEAPDGEMALPLLQAVRPDVLITDIKMPFMDGLQLCKIVRESIPHTKIIILSGHDEFEYAQEAITLGVMEYLLKPVGVQDLHNVLQKVAVQLQQEQAEKEKLQELRDQAEDNQAVLRERFLLKLVMGAVSPLEAIQRSQLLGIDILAKCYRVAIIKVDLCGTPEQFDYHAYQHVQHMLSDLVENNPDVFLLKKDMEELILVVKGNSPEYLQEEVDFLLEQIKRQVEDAKCQLAIGVGTCKNRITELYKSFIEALANLQNAADKDRPMGSNSGVDKAGLLKVDKSAVGNYLKCGIKEEFDDFFDAHIRPLGEMALRSYIVKNYIVMDIILATSQFVDELGGDVDQVIPEMNHIEDLLMNIKTVEQIREQTESILANALAFRDGQTISRHVVLIQQAKKYIDSHYMDADISLNEVSAQVYLSPSHFSVVFGQEMGETFKEYLTGIRIRKAKELLRTTSLRSYEIALEVGYNDPHYFSYLFRKNTGLSPTEFRLQAQVE
jgi:two-component system response regulator YesN